MKIPFFVFLIGTILLAFIAFFPSCKKINEATQLGDKLVPAVDNVHTFEVALSTVTVNSLFNDTTQVLYTDDLAAGDLDDPEFGHTHANFDFSISPSLFGGYPFVKQDSLNIDSVVLSLSFKSAYGDTLNNGSQTLRVFQIDPNSTFSDTALFKYNDPATDFATTGAELGSTTFNVKNVRDTITLIRGSDTTKVNNVVRIRLDNLVGFQLAQFDTTNGYKNDSIFNHLFRGFSIQADPTGNVISYFNVSDVANTKLTVYFRYGLKDTASFDYIHPLTRGQANYINRQNGGNYLTYLNSGPSDKIYLQSAPGSYVAIKIPGLDTFGNKVIHRAEIVAQKIPSILDDVFTPPVQLMLDRKNSFTPDTVFMLQNDLVADATGVVGFPAFGGSLLKDDTYRFNVSRYVQSIITKHTPNDSLRIYAPLRAEVFNSSLGIPISVPVVDAISRGRVVLGGGSYADSTQRLRLRIIYSNL